MRKFQLEMGGKNPLIVLDDADLKIAVECAVNGAFFSTGHAAPRPRASSHAGDLCAFRGGDGRRMKGLVVDDALERNRMSGRVVDQNQARSGDLSYVRIRQGRRGQLALGGDPRRACDAGLSINDPRPCSPTSDNSMRIAREEIFGRWPAMIPARGLRPTP